MSFTDLVRRMFRRPFKGGTGLQAGARRTILNLTALEDRTNPTPTVTVSALDNIIEGGSSASFHPRRPARSASASP